MAYAEIVDRYPDVTIAHHVGHDGVVWATCKRRILCRESGSWRHFALFPLCLPRDLFGFSRLTSRPMRADKCNVYVNTSNVVLGIRGGWVYHICRDAHPRQLVNIHGDCVLHRSICEDNQGWSYFGEYFRNPARKSVRIWRISPDASCGEVACEFPQGSIRHVHGVYADPHNPQKLWVTVGDQNGDCFIFTTDNRFATLDRWGDGSQLWRAVTLFFTKTHVSWLTDSPIRQNNACRVERDSMRLEVGQAIAASAWYGTTTTEGVHVAFTTVEPGPAIHRRESSILISDDAFHWQEVFSFRKDLYRPMRLFKYGVISCPSGLLSAENLLVSGEGLVGLDGCTVSIRIRR